MIDLERYDRKLGLKAESTRRNYGYALNKFLKKTGLSKEGLIKLAETDLDEVELLVAEVMQSEIAEGKRPTTAKLIYKGVRFFMKAVGFKNFSLDRDDKPRGVYNGPRKISKMQIREIYDAFSQNFKVRNRAILMFLKDSGLRISDASQLSVEQFLGATQRTQDGERFLVFDPFETQKTGDIAHIHIGPEAVEAVERHVGDRKTGPLFLNQYGKRLSSQAISELFSKVKKRRDLKGNYVNISAHSLRKFHYTELPFREDWIKWLEGKATGVYVEDPSKVTQAYMDNYEALRVFTSNAKEDAERDKRIEELEAQLKEERRTRLMLEKKLSVQTEDINKLSQGHANMTAKFTVRNKKIEKLENKVETLLEIAAISVDETGVTPFVDQANHLSLIEEALKRIDLIEMKEESMEYLVTYKDGKLTVKPLIHKSRRDASSSYKKK